LVYWVNFSVSFTLRYYEVEEMERELFDRAEAIQERIVQLKDSL
jgi:hypothetical protein